MLLLSLGACAGLAAASTLDVAWQRDGKLTTVQLEQGSASPRHAFDGARLVPLGSVWKLFVFVYATDEHIAMPDYRCSGRLPDEVYCCDPGQTVNAPAALAQSCGLFFAPQRLMVDPGQWRRYWTRRLGTAPTANLAWLADPAQLQPGLAVRLDSLLRALGSIPAASREPAEAALLRVVLDGRGADTVRWFGSRLRVKTYSWFEPGDRNARLGGAAGWLADGTPVWFGGRDTSGGIFQKWARQLAAALPQDAGPRDSGCVEVDFFTRYPIRSVRGPEGEAVPGPLVGRHVVTFQNGQTLAMRGVGEMTLARDGAGVPRVQGRFGVNEYVARVLVREGATSEPEAAKALAIAARSYLQQNAQVAAGCQRIADSSATQRVSPNPAPAAALAIARWTDQLIIDGTPVHYHSTAGGRGTLAWSRAVAQAQGGRQFDAILAEAFPGGVLGTETLGGARCQRLTQNEQWLARMVPLWERALRREPGYEHPAQLPAVCALQTGMPYSEQSRNRIFMRPLASREDRITLAHEYVHIGLQRHPRGQDEDYVEQLARRLNDIDLGAL